MKALLLLLAATSCCVSAADWQLDSSKSSLNFVSIKNEMVAETHHFSNLAGSWSADGKVSVTVPVATLETQIPIRNERILQFVLQAEKFANITATTTVKPDMFNQLAVGESTVLNLTLALNIAGNDISLPAVIRVLKVSNSQLQATTEAPVLLNVETANLATGVAKLQELAKLNSITKFVPVTFSVSFHAE